MVTGDQLALLVLFFIPFLFSLSFHEYAHGWMAKRKGDRTAEIMGRLTLNPMAHIDWIGTVALPIASFLTGLPLFGWAQPVPVNERNLAHPKQDMFWIALAGPLSNVLLFLMGLLVLFILAHQTLIVPSLPMRTMLEIFLRFNLYLAFFNLIPLHPLDGGKVLARFLPIKWEIWLDRNQQMLSMVLMLLVIFGAFRILALPVEWLVSNSWDLVVR